MAQGAVSFKLTDIHMDLVNFGTNVNVSATISKYIQDDLNAGQTIAQYPGQMQVAAVALGALTVVQLKAQTIAYLQNLYPYLQGQVIG